MLDANKKVLVVDDMRSARMLTISCIVPLGLKNYIEAENGEIALKIAKDPAQNIGLILSDWNMPVMNGFDFLKNLKKDEFGKKIPFIFISGEAEKKYIQEAEAVGALGLIDKPINPEKIKIALEKFLTG